MQIDESAYPFRTVLIVYELGIFSFFLVFDAFLFYTYLGQGAVPGSLSGGNLFPLFSSGALVDIFFLLKLAISTSLLLNVAAALIYNKSKSLCVLAMLTKYAVIVVPFLPSLQLA